MRPMGVAWCGAWPAASGSSSADGDGDAVGRARWAVDPLGCMPDYITF